MVNYFFKQMPILALLLILSSCGSSDQNSIAQICQSSSALCSDLNKINACRYKRSSLIRARYYDQTASSEAHTLNLLDELSDYESCLELTMLMQYTPDMGRKQKIVDNYFTTKKLMENKLQDVKNTQNPHIAYYLWTHFQDAQAKSVFMKAATQKDTKDAELLIKLAMTYAKSYPQYSLDLFYKALRFSHSLQEVPQNTFAFMLTLFYQHKDFEHAYIWALIANKVNDKEALPINFDLILQKGLINSKKLIHNETVLQASADSYYTQLKTGKFNAPTPQLAH